MNTLRFLKAGVLATLVLILGTFHLHAANYVWTGGVDDNFATDGNWNLSGSPGSLDSSYIRASTNNPVIVNSSESVTNFFMADQAANDVNAELQTGGSLSASNIYIGHSGTAQFIQSAGVTDVTTNLALGFTGTGVGSYQISDGILNVGLTLGLGRSGSTGNFEVIGSNPSINPNVFSMQSASSSLIFSLDSSGVSPINVTNNIAANGTLTINQGTFAPLIAGSLTLMTYTGSFTGSFVTENLPAGYSITHDTTAKTLDLNYVAIPEPGTLLLVGIAGVVTLILHKRRFTTTK